MQMLEVTNNLLKANCDKETRMRKLCVRTYAVLPVSEKSGLLKWVEGPVPLHHLLKNYLKRDKERTAIARAIMADKGGGWNSLGAIELDTDIIKLRGMLEVQEGHVQMWREV